MFGARGGKFSNARPKSDVDWAIHRARQCPGPGEYRLDANYKVSGGKFNMSKAKTEVEWIEHRAAKIPGPGDYRIADQTTSLTGGKFSTARPKSSLDWTIYKSKQEPGPGQYDIDAYRKVVGGRFSTAVPKSDVDIKIKVAKESPGPGQYSLDSKMLQMSGGKFNLSKPKTDVDWAIIRSSQIPGPQDYNSDSSYRVGGGKFSNARPKSALDLAIFNGKQQPGPGEYNPEVSSIGNRTGRKKNLPSAPSNFTPSRPHSAPIPPEARGKVKPREGDVFTQHSLSKSPPRRPVTSLGVRDPANKPRGEMGAADAAAAAHGVRDAAAAAPRGDRASSAPPVRVFARPQSSRPAPSSSSASASSSSPAPGAPDRKEVHSARGRQAEAKPLMQRGTTARAEVPRKVGAEVPRRRPMTALGIQSGEERTTRPLSAFGGSATGRPLGRTPLARPQTSSSARPAASRLSASWRGGGGFKGHSISVQASEEELSALDGDVIIESRPEAFVPAEGVPRRRTSHSQSRGGHERREHPGGHEGQRHERREHPLSSTMAGNVGRAHMRVSKHRGERPQSCFPIYSIHLRGAFLPPATAPDLVPPLSPDLVPPPSSHLFTF